MFAVTRQYDGIIAAFEKTVRDVNIAARDDIHSVAVGDQQVVVDPQAAYLHPVAVHDHKTPVRRIDALEILQRHVSAFAKNDHLVVTVFRIERPVSQSLGNFTESESLTGLTALVITDNLGLSRLHELHTMTVDKAVARNRNVRRLFGIENTRQFAVVALVLREVQRSAQLGTRLHAEFDIRTQVERPHQIGACRNEHHATTVGMATVDSLLNAGRSECFSVSRSAESPYIIHGCGGRAQRCTKGD